jgi:hypothetical protein
MRPAVGRPTWLLRDDTQGGFYEGGTRLEQTNAAIASRVAEISMEFAAKEAATKANGSRTASR